MRVMIRQRLATALAFAILVAITFTPAAFGQDFDPAPPQSGTRPTLIALALAFCVAVTAMMPSKRTHRD